MMIDKTSERDRERWEQERVFWRGCGNHGCRVTKPKGQATNGPCRCERRLREMLAQARREGWETMLEECITHAEEIQFHEIPGTRINSLLKILCALAGESTND
jgi:hypothetical protein